MRSTTAEVRCCADRTTTARPRGLTIALALSLLPGCYLSHERARLDAAAPADAPVVPRDARPPCGAGDIQVDVAVYSTQTQSASGGTVVLEGEEGELDRDRRSERLEACAPREAAPVTASFLLAHGGTVLSGVDGAIRGEVTTGELSPARETDRFSLTTGTLVRTVEGSRFRVHVDPYHLVELTDSPFEMRCTGVLGPCRLRFLELAPDGALLGGGAVERRTERDTVVLESVEREIRRRTVEVRLPDTGLLAGVPLLRVIPLACDEDVFGATLPGNLDVWRCAESGVAEITSSDAERARAELSYLDGARVRTDFVAAVLADGAGLEAVSVEPCCEGDIAFRFGEVRQLEARGETVHTLRFTADAPGYDRVFAYEWEPGSGYALYAFRPGARFDDVGYPAPALRMSRPTDPPRELFVGAITTEGGPPWSRAHRAAWVRRVYLTGPHTWVP